MLRKFVEFLIKHPKLPNHKVRKCMQLVRGAIQTHCAMLNVDPTLGGSGFRLLALKMWQLDKQSFSQFRVIIILFEMINEPRY